MSQEERYGNRDLTYSAWHRRNSIGRHVGQEEARLLAMIDIDASIWIESHDATKKPLVLIETAKDIGQDCKPSTILTNLAIRCDLPAYLVLYKVSERPNPADPTCKDIDAFRIKRLYPVPEHTFRTLTPAEWANGLIKAREHGLQKIEACGRMRKTGHDPLVCGLHTSEKCYCAGCIADGQWKKDFTISRGTNV